MSRRFQGRSGDLGAIAGAGFVALVTAGDAEERGILVGEPLFLALLLAGLGCLALWWRRSHPIAVALLLAPLAVITDLVGGAVLVAVYTVAARRSWPAVAGVSGLHLAAGVPYSIARPDPDLTPLGTSVLSLLLLSGAVALGAAAGRRRAARLALIERLAAAETAAARRADQLRALERQRIAREMHDVLAHRISLVSLHAGALEIRTDLSAEQVARAAGTIRAAAHQALEELREILGVLRAGPVADPRPGLAELPELLAECSAAGTPVRIDNQLPVGAAQPVPAVDHAAYRVVQEGLTNARKHAPGVPVRLVLDRTPAGELRLWLRNRLPTSLSPAPPGAHAGLIGLAERVGLAGGRIDHGVRRDPSGEIEFHLEAWMPWPIRSGS